MPSNPTTLTDEDVAILRESLSGLSNTRRADVWTIIRKLDAITPPSPSAYGSTTTMLSNPTTLSELIAELEMAQQERMPWSPELAQSYADLMERAAKVLRAVEGASVGNACPEHLAPGYPTVCSGCAVDARIDAAIAAGLREQR